MDADDGGRLHGDKGSGGRMIDFTGVSAINIPEGNVEKIANAAGEVLWEKPSGNVIDYISAIQSDGACSIDTGFYPNHNTRIVMDVAIVSDSAVTTGIFGGRSATNSAARAMWYMSEKTVRSDYAAQTMNMACSGFGERFTIDANKNVTTINGTSHTHTVSEFQSTGPLMLFDINTGGSPNKRRAKVICWGAKVYDDGTLVRDYRPCIDPNGVVCMYEEIAQEYVYTSEGAFTALTDTGIAVKVSFSDDGGATDRFLSELGVLTVGGVQITSAEQTVMLPTNTTSVDVVYTLSSAITYARSVSVGGETVGTIQNAGEAITFNKSVADGDTITITMTQL